MRWADLDMLNHVNNVTYLEYAAEAQAILASDGSMPADRPSEVTVRFMAPMVLSRTPVTVTSRFDDAGLVQEIGSGQGGATINARVTTTWGHVEPPAIPEGAREDPLTTHLRIGDVQTDRRVTTPKAFELAQENRVLRVSHYLSRRSAGQFVVGTVTVRFHGDLIWRPEPYTSYGWLSRAGARSFTVEAVILDDGVPLLSATSMMFGFDLEAQRSRTFSDEERELLARAVRA